MSNSVGPLPRSSSTMPRNSVVSNGLSIHDNHLHPPDNHSTMATPSPIGSVSSGLHDNLFLHPEVHNPVAGNKKKSTVNGNGFNHAAAAMFSPVTVEITADEMVSDGIAARRLCGLLGPLVFLMTCVGLYHPSKEDVEPERDACWGGSLCIRQGFIAWCVVVAVYLLYNMIAIGYYTDLSNGLSIISITEIFVVLRLAHALLTLIWFFVMFESSSRYEEMLETWCIWLRWQTERNMNMLRKRIWTIALFAVIQTFVYSLLIGLAVYGKLPGFGLEYSAFVVRSAQDQQWKWHRALKVNFVLVFTICNLIQSLLVGTFTSICYVLAHEMQLLSREIHVEVRGQAVIWDMKIEPLSGQEVTTLEYLRRKHGKIMAVASAVDVSFRELLFFVYIVHVPSLTFLLYVLVVVPSVETSNIKGTLILFTIWSATQMFLSWTAAVAVRHWAYEPAKILHTIDIHEKKEITHAHQTSFYFFMTSLTSQKFAMTLWNIVPLTKEFAIIVTGLIIVLLVILMSPAAQLHVTDATHWHAFVIAAPTEPSTTTTTLAATTTTELVGNLLVTWRNLTATSAEMGQEPLNWTLVDEDMLLGMNERMLNATAPP